MIRLVPVAALSLMTLTTFGCHPKGSHNSDVSAVQQGSLFDDSAILTVELRAPLKAMQDAKDKRETYEVDLETGDADPPWFGESVTFKAGASAMKAKVRVRGGVRFNCSFPPIKLKLSKDDAGNTPFAGFKAFKIGTHCEPADDHRVKSYHEHALYLVYGVLSKLHFRSRLLNIRYIDSDSSLDITEPGLLLEDPEDVAEHVSGLQELKLNWLEQATPPSVSDPDEVKRERQENQSFAMVRTLRVEAIEAERLKRQNSNPGTSADTIDESMRRDRDQIWRQAGLPGFTDPIADPESLLKKMGDALAPRQQQIARRQEELKTSLDRITIARILAFEILALNTDWNVFGARRFLGGKGGGSNDQIKNSKVLRDRNGRIFAVPYDFDQASVFGKFVDVRREYEALLTKVLAGLGDDTVPTRKEFVIVLQEFINAESEMVTAASNAHLGKEDQDRMVSAVHAFVDLARTFVIH